MDKCFVQGFYIELVMICSEWRKMSAQENTEAPAQEENEVNDGEH